MNDKNVSTTKTLALLVSAAAIWGVFLLWGADPPTQTETTELGTVRIGYYVRSVEFVYNTNTTDFAETIRVTVMPYPSVGGLIVSPKFVEIKRSDVATWPDKQVLEGVTNVNLIKGFWNARFTASEPTSTNVVRAVKAMLVPANAWMITPVPPVE